MNPVKKLMKSTLSDIRKTVVLKLKTLEYDNLQLVNKMISEVLGDTLMPFLGATVSVGCNLLRFLLIHSRWIVEPCQ